MSLDCIGLGCVVGQAWISEGNVATTFDSLCTRNNEVLTIKDTFHIGDIAARLKLNYHLDYYRNSCGFNNRITG